MEDITILCLALVFGHVITILTIMAYTKQALKDMKAIVLEREETNRSYFVTGPEMTTDSNMYKIHPVE